MDLELAVAESCNSVACRVRYVDDQTALDAQYSAPVQDRIKIRPGDLVAVDRSVNPVALVWRWRHGTVEQVNGDSVTVQIRVTQRRPDDPDRASVELVLPEGLKEAVTAGDTVFFDHGGEGGGVILDVARNGMPAHAASVRSQAFPAIFETYDRMTK
ncbi:MAG: hypothetical protein ACR2HB_04065, partial [Dehalococcoidia bacterium]